MSDFYQHGLITTLHRLRPTPAEFSDGVLREWTRQRPFSLVIPCHGGDLRQPALARMAEVLREIDFLHEIVVSMNGLAEGDFAFASRLFGDFKTPVSLLWNDGPELRPVYDAHSDATFPGFMPGKGFNLWAGLVLLAAKGETVQVAMHDADIASFDRDFLIRLALPLAAPDLGFRFCKGYYSRVSDRFYGRVTRLFIAPLLRSLIGVAGHHPLLDYLDSFRYPLSGECAVELESVGHWRFPAHWGVEVGLLCESHRHLDASAVAQIDLAGRYEHKHQLPGSAEEGSGLARMADEIARSLLSHLAEEGAVMDVRMAEAVRRGYDRHARETVRRYAADAMVNAVAFDLPGEESLVRLFAGALDHALEAEGAPISASALLPPPATRAASALGVELAGKVRSLKKVSPAAENA